MLKDWQNRGILLWTTGTTAVTLATSVTSYELSSNTINALEVVLSRDNTDIQLTRITPEEYLIIPAPTQTGSQLNTAYVEVEIILHYQCGLYQITLQIYLR